MSAGASWYYLEADHPTRPERVGSTPKLVDRTYRDAAVHGEYEWDYAFISAFTTDELGDVVRSGEEVGHDPR